MWDGWGAVGWGVVRLFCVCVCVRERERVLAILTMKNIQLIVNLNVSVYLWGVIIKYSMFWERKKKVLEWKANATRQWRDEKSAFWTHITVLFISSVGVWGFSNASVYMCTRVNVHVWLIGLTWTDNEQQFDVLLHFRWRVSLGWTTSTMQTLSMRWNPNQSKDTFFNEFPC